MLELRPGGECCDTDLVPDFGEALICTFCAPCATKMNMRRRAGQKTLQGGGKTGQ